MTPRWFIYRHAGMVNGIRGEKFVPLKPPVGFINRAVTAISNHFRGPYPSPVSHHLTGIATKMNGYVPAETKTFQNWEYRFWAAEIQDEKLNVAECRVCQVCFPDNDARKLHIGKMGCSKVLCAAYGLLLKDRLCVICNHWTKYEKWGVPICSAACIEAWCTSESQPASLKGAIECAHRQGLIRP